MSKLSPLGDSCLLRESLSEMQFQKTGYIKMFYIYLSRGAYKEAQSFLIKCKNINPNDLETLYWTGMFEKHINRDTVNGNNYLKEFYSTHHVNFFLNSVLKSQRDFDRFFSHYPYLSEGHKQKVIQAVEMKDDRLAKKHFDLYKLYGKLELDEGFVRQYEDKIAKEKK